MTEGKKYSENCLLNSLLEHSVLALYYFMVSMPFDDLDALVKRISDYRDTVKKCRKETKP